MRLFYKIFLSFKSFNVFSSQLDACISAINDYIKLINSYPVNKKTEDLNKKLKQEQDPIKQANILMEILTLKGVKQ